ILSPVAHITYIPPIPTRRSSDLERVLDLLAVHRENDVTGLHAGSGRRTVLARLRDQGATGPRQAEAVGDVGAHVLDADAEEAARSEEHTSELQSRENLVCRLLLE